MYVCWYFDVHLGLVSFSTFVCQDGLMIGLLRFASDKGTDFCAPDDIHVESGHIDPSFHLHAS
jgi:hypothetical protein